MALEMGWFAVDRRTGAVCRESIHPDAIDNLVRARAHRLTYRDVAHLRREQYLWAWFGGTTFRNWRSPATDVWARYRCMGVDPVRRTLDFTAVYVCQHWERQYIQLRYCSFDETWVPKASFFSVPIDRTAG